MIHTLLLTYVLAAGQNPLVCKQILDPNFCKGPSAEAPGLQCVWQQKEFECKAMDLRNPKVACKALGHDQGACQQRTECHFDMFDMECKGYDMEYPEYKHPEYEGGRMLPGQTSRTGAVPQAYPGATGARGMPGAATLPGARPVVTPGATGAQPAVNPNQPYGSQSQLPVTPVAPRPPVVSTSRPVIQPPAPVRPASPPRTPSTPNAQSNGSNQPRFCKSLPELQCFGPALEPGKLCYWDAEDFECSEATTGSIEAVCKQYGRDPTACDANENCFWDAKDFECSEIEYGMHFMKPVLQEQCSIYRQLSDCASRATCFFDTASNLCMNVVQASNVCGVYTSPALCSTNRLCQFQNGMCTLARTPQAGGLSGLHLQSVHENTNAAAGSTTSTDYVVMMACGFTGSLLGLLFAMGTQKLCQRKASQEDYRDIVLDVNSQRRQVV